MRFEPRLDVPDTQRDPDRTARVPIARIWAAALAVVLATTLACSGSSGSGEPNPGPSPSPTPSPEPGLRVSLFLTAFGDVTPDLIRSMLVRALNTEGTAVLAESRVPTVTGLPVRTTLQVPAGVQVPFTVEGFDAQGSSIYRGATRADVPEATLVEVTVDLPTNPPPPPPQNDPPRVELTSPTDGSLFLGAETIVFQGRVSDPDEPAPGLTVVWTSDRLGPIVVTPPDEGGAVGFQIVAAALPLGEHLITLFVADSQGTTASAAVHIEIREPDPGPGPGPGPGGASAPRIDSISPDQGPTLGGTQVTILGHDFRPGGAVFFKNQAVPVRFEDDHEIHVTTPPGNTGSVDVMLVNPDGGQTKQPNSFAYDKTLYVQPASSETEDGSSLHPFSSIVGAGVRAQSGYLVKIREGVYHETVVVPSLHSIRFEGAGAGRTIIDGSDGKSTDPVFGIVESDDIEVSGLSIVGGPSAGLIVVGGGQSRASDLAVAQNQDGVLVGTGSVLTLDSSRVASNRGNGVLVAGGELLATGLQVVGNGAVGFGAVMEADGQSQSTVLRDSTISQNGDFGVLGVIDESIDHLRIEGNQIDHNGQNGPVPGLILIANAGPQASEVYQVVGNQIGSNPGSGVIVTDGANATIGGGGSDRNSIRDNDGFAISCEPGARASCPAGGNGIEGNDLGEIDPNCPKSCKP